MPFSFTIKSPGRANGTVVVDLHDNVSPPVVELSDADVSWAILSVEGLRELHKALGVLLTIADMNARTNESVPPK